MEKNEFLLCSEVIYRINVCRTVEELRGVLLAQLKLIIPYACASIIPIQEDPDSHEIRHGTPFCWPEAFQEVEQRWIEGIDQAYTAWLSHAREPVLLRDSEVLGEEERFSIPTYRFYERNGYRFYDCLQMNLVYSEQVLGRLSLYRTRREGLFTEKEAFYLRVLANHINLAYARCLEQEERNRGRASLPELVQTYHLTPREGEILGLIFQDWNNEEILEKLRISRYTLLKHLQNIYRKCGVSSRWNLRKLGPEETGQKGGCRFANQRFPAVQRGGLPHPRLPDHGGVPHHSFDPGEAPDPLCLRQFHPHPHGPEDPGGHPRRALLLSPPPLSRRRRGGSRPSTGGTACGSAMPQRRWWPGTASSSPGTAGLTPPATGRSIWTTTSTTACR